MKRLIITNGGRKKIFEKNTSRQRKWMGHKMRRDSLIKTIIETRIEKEIMRRRPRVMLQD